MKIILDEEQVFLIEKKLKELELNYTPLQNEILDHICCMTESRMQNGETFEQATQMIFEIIGKDELKELQQQTISLTHQKSSRMKKFIFGLTACLLAISIFSFYSNLEQQSKSITNSIQPPSPQEVMTHENQNGKPVVLFASVEEPPSIQPLNGDFKINSGFGKRYHPVFKKEKFHKGIDFKAPLGTPVLATADGVVISADSHKKHGNHIVLKHDEDFQTKYSHLSELKIVAGQKVKKGDVIGLVGTTGMATAPHLHYEVIKNGKEVNPIDYFNP